MPLQTRAFILVWIFYSFFNMCDAYSLLPLSQTSLFHLSFISKTSYFPQFHIYVVSVWKVSVFTLAQSMLTLFLVCTAQKLLNIPANTLIITGYNYFKIRCHLFRFCFDQETVSTNCLEDLFQLNLFLKNFNQKLIFDEENQRTKQAKCLYCLNNLSSSQGWEDLPCFQVFLLSFSYWK